MCNSFEIDGYTVANIGKEKNGDAFCIQDLENEKILIAIVSDGVSRQPCDYLASDIVCEKFLEYFEVLSNENIEDRIMKSLKALNLFVINYEGKCSKMAATLSLFICNYSSMEYYISNVGDSRIYSVKNEKIDCLTKDDVVFISENIPTKSGIRKTQKPQLSKVIGQSGIEFQIEKRDLERQEMILLGTDGFYEARKGTFDKKIIELFHADNFKKQFGETGKLFEIFRADDMTFVALKIKG